MTTHQWQSRQGLAGREASAQTRALVPRQHPDVNPGGGAPTSTSSELPEPRPLDAVRARPFPERTAVALADAAVLLPLLLVWRSLFAVVLVAIATLTWTVRGLYRRRITLSSLDDLGAVVLGFLVGLGTAAVVVPDALSAASLPVLAAGTGLVLGIALARTTVYAYILHRRIVGKTGYRTLVVGSGTATHSLVERIEAHPESGLRLVGGLTDHHGESLAPLPVLGTSSDLTEVVRRERITDVIIGYGGISSAHLVDVLRTAECVSVEIHIVPRLFELRTLRGCDDHIWGLPVLQLRNSAQRALTWRAKRAFDLVVCLSAALLLAPVMAAVALVVRSSLGAPVIFRQTRVGLNGNTFDLLKFRSMAPSTTPNAGAWTVPVEQMGRVGRFIRRYSLDELPQLLNVIRGDMSLVGPRPERPEYVVRFSAVVPRYQQRHRVPVGLTGLAAVNGLRGNTSIEDRAHFDNWYIENWSLWLDVKILLRTLGAVLRGTGS